MNTFYIYCLFLTFFISIDARKLIFNKLECLETNNDACGEVACSVGKKQKSMSLGCTMKRSSNEMKAHVKVTYINPKMKTPHSMEARMDACDILNGRIDSAAIKMGMPLVRTFLPQFAKECPFSGRIEVDNFDPNEIMSMFPPLAPSGDYTWELELTNDRDELLIHPKISFTVKK